MKKALVFALSAVLPLMLSSVSARAVAARTPSRGAFDVSPSGDQSGETDWSNIMAAFEHAVAAGPGSTVRLAAGDFYVHRPIQVANFSGTVSGQAKDLTRLHTAPGRPFGLMEYPELPVPKFVELYFDTSWPADQTADVIVSDLSFYVDGPSEPWSSHDPQNQWNSMGAVVEVRGILEGYLDPNYADFDLTHVNATFRHLRAVADTGPQYHGFHSSIINGFQAWGEWVVQLDPTTNAIFSRWVKPIAGTYVFEDIETYDVPWGLSVYFPTDSTIRIGGSENNRVLARRTGNPVYIVPITLWNISNSTAEVSYLDASGVDGGVWVMQGQEAAWGNDLGELVPEMLPGPSSFVFRHNRFSSERAGTPWAAFELWNPGGELGQPLGNVVITDNRVNVLDHDPPFEAIFSYHVDNAQITNNRITGSGVGAIWVEPYATPAEGWLLQANNLNGFSAQLAGIYLGPGTTSCTVVGGKVKASVIDDGTNNTLVGVNNQRGNPPGPALREALHRKQEAIRSLP